MSQQSALHKLQTIDSDLDERRARVRAIKAALEDDNELRQAQDEVATLNATLQPQDARIKDLNLEIQTVGTQSSQLSTRLYSGKVGNPKELQDIQDKIAELKRRHEQLENMLLETMITADDLREELADANTRLAQVETAWSASQAELSEELQTKRREIKKLKVLRETAVGTLDPQSLALYDSLRTNRQGMAVAVLDGEACGVCGVRQTSVLVHQTRQGQAITTCASCGRILVAV